MFFETTVYKEFELDTNILVLMLSTLFVVYLHIHISVFLMWNSLGL